MKKSLGYLVIILFVMCSLLSTSAYSQDMENVIGLGLGLPYGVLGLNYELGIHDYIAPTVGVGFALSEFAWNAGVRAYYPGRDASFRGRATVLYGTNSIIDDPYEDEYTTDEGMSIGLGLNWRYSEHWAFDFDVFNIQSDAKEELEDKIEEHGDSNRYTVEEYGGDVKISLGFSYRF